jgi:hypothetical protein
MNPPSMETIFLILSGVILFAGVMYWMWSHLQLTQKKVQLLENAVFELRAMIPGGGTTGPPPTAAPVPIMMTGGGATAASKTYNDLADDDWDVQAPVEPVPEKSTPLDAMGPANTPELVTQDLGTDTDLPMNDLMPGGRADGVPTEEIGADAEVQEVELTEKKFKELFASRMEAAATVATATPAASLEGMPLKELRRLGEQRGVRGASEMRKKELLAALRSQVAAPANAVQEEKTLDLEAVETAGAAEEEVVEPAAEEEAEILE